MKKFTSLCFSVFLLSFIWLGSAQQNQKTIVIDAGHGGKDPGNIQENVQEKDFTFQLSNTLREALEEKGYEVILLRENDEYMSLNERIERINEIKPKLVLSLHANAAHNTSKNGIEIYFAEGEDLNETNSNFISKLTYNLTSQTKYKEVNIKTANFKILTESNSPALVLELGFMSNPKDLAYIKSKKGQQEIAKALTASL
ncbi:N-acetylmuramoyl-L-alanine amidase [Mesonia sp. MT50]|uniref:N-acetylmuramoyl-L-alanine amidase n=1 Tax=Mesonia profundi TaxID=3070998 RepID=A0ABU1A150_9FLAO|nr:N-acetylmuramoyl-L-alanine amidase [Mesonia profundi]MDQ7917435.1 N-acetylmuramoyl-L-alanine amidase [Mesonia profundi]